MNRKVYIAVTAALASMLLWSCGESDNKTAKKNATQNVTEAQTEEKIENAIDYESDGEPVKDATVFGENTYVFSPEDDKNEIQSKVNEIYKKQETNQFGKERYAILFKPGEYDTALSVNVGYYTQVSGLGVLPTDTNINKLWVNADWMYHNATCNFWRSAENFSVNEYCMWANSQAVSLRRMKFNDGRVLSDGEGWSSGGFMADCYSNGTVSSGSQQQYLTRNDFWRLWDGGVWNMVFVGIDTVRTPAGTWPYSPYTKVQTTPVIQEKPYLTYDEEYGYGVIVPELRTDAVGVSWESGTKGKFVSLNKFYIANPNTDDADTINEALAAGKNLLLTPGIYEINKPLNVKNSDTIVYGMGMATIVSVNGNKAMKIADVDGVKIAGVLFEAGEKESDTLLEVGAKKSDVSHGANPTTLSDVYFRVGGSSYEGKVKNCITVNSNDVIGDNLWVWRADHGDNVAWDKNTAKNGAVIHGDNVIMYGLFVEHFQEYQTIWDGNGGRLYFYQSEIPYDVPNQSEFMSNNGKVNGFASLKVGDNVLTFESYGVGVYSYNRDATITIDRAVEVPDIEGVKLHNTVTVMLNGHPGIEHVINNSGYGVKSSGATARIVEYENGEQNNMVSRNLE